ncbi:MerR family transcriptional regulator [Micromonospora sonchi]|uniref:MerR family transcriptional regulator n=2 Tax=Micromonospora sonchi TaxID=1763543 RepID=A0A917THG8_9ACTN|nr:MerR family transcriptional regulator [Micromonospora sonchi]
MNEPAASTPSGAGRAHALMSIGEVLSQLRTDFPDVTISKLRFLEAEGLVEPQRTAAGYRKYGWDDVARLRFVLTAQRDQYLPLRVIREQLAQWDASGEVPERSRPALVAVGPDGEVPGRAAPVQSAQVRLDRTELLARSGLDSSTLGELERLGLVVSDPPGWYDGDALIIAGAVAGLAAYGFQPRHLRGYRTSADREIGLFAQLVAPLARQSDPAARARAAEAARELVALSQQLHAALVRVGLRSTLGR